MRFVVTVDRDEDGIFVAECPAIPGCVSQGVTESEALKNIENAIRECLEVRAEKGMPLTVAVHQVDISRSRTIARWRVARCGHCYEAPASR
jgi:predicted RNase H-like HicB family nuclease